MRDKFLEKLIESINQGEDKELNPEANDPSEVIRNHGTVIIYSGITADKENFGFELKPYNGEIAALPLNRDFQTPLFFSNIKSSDKIEKIRKKDYVIYYVKKLVEKRERHKGKRDASGNKIKKTETGYYDGAHQTYSWWDSDRTENYNDVESELGPDEMLRMQSRDWKNIIFSIRYQPKTAEETAKGNSMAAKRKANKIARLEQEIAFHKAELERLEKELAKVNK
jgi:hypothetical protein